LTATAYASTGSMPDARQLAAIWSAEKPRQSVALAKILFGNP
jgi:hypothetical protein